MKPNINYERAVLSAIIFEPELIRSVDLKSSDFNHPFHKKLYTLFVDFDKKNIPIEEEVLRSQLLKRGEFDEVSMLDILSSNPITNVNYYANQIKESTRDLNFEKELKLISSQDSTPEQKAKLIMKANENFYKESSVGLNFAKVKDIKRVLPTFLLQNFIPLNEHEINLFTASGGGGKSFTGALILGKLSKTKRVFGFFSEDELGVTASRIDYLKRIYDDLGDDFVLGGADSITESFVSKNEHGNIVPSDGWYKFKQKMSNFDVILLDPFIAFFDQDENSNSEVRAFCNILNRYCKTEKKTIILIHHHSKSGTSRGASSLVDAVRIHYNVEVLKDKDGELDESKKHLRNLNLVKKNHWTGKTNFEIQLFEKEIKPAFEIVYEEEESKYEEI